MLKENLVLATKESFDVILKWVTTLPKSGMFVAGRILGQIFNGYNSHLQQLVTIRIKSMFSSIENIENSHVLLFSYLHATKVVNIFNVFTTVLGQGCGNLLLQSNFRIFLQFPIERSEIDIRNSLFYTLAFDQKYQQDEDKCYEKLLERFGEMERKGNEFMQKEFLEHLLQQQSFSQFRFTEWLKDEICKSDIQLHQ